MATDDKKFWGRDNTTRKEFYAWMRPRPSAMDEQPFQFRVNKVSGDGDCGFHVIGIPRVEAADCLLEHFDDETIRNMGYEIKSMIRVEGEDTLPICVRDEDCERLVKERESLESLTVWERWRRMTQLVFQLRRHSSR